MYQAYVILDFFGFFRFLVGWTGHNHIQIERRRVATVRAEAVRLIAGPPARRLFSRSVTSLLCSVSGPT